LEWLNISPEAGLGGLFVASFLAATLLPGGSEAALYAFLQLHPDDGAAALLLATLGNTAGGMTSWACGRWLPARQPAAAQRPLQAIRRYGAPALLFAWAPVIGDALCVAAGWLRLHWLPCTLFMAAGKLGRYWLVAQAAT